jgi:ribosomal-protein-alanine N-acetyltransferase
MEIRRLTLQDLDTIVEIENAVYPTPWSRSMFAGELAKPSSFSLGAFDADEGGLVAYLIVSRYVDAWHIMNVAVRPEYRRQGVASRLLDELFAPGVHARGARLQRDRDRSLRAVRLRAERNPPRVLHR